MSRVGRALLIHELLERARDRWVIVVTALFVLLASGIGLYGRAAEEAAAMLTAPSLVTLCALLVPLVALVLGHDAIVGERERHTLGLLLSLPVGRTEVLVAKYLGRALALALAIGAGLGTASLVVSSGRAGVLLALVPPTLLLGASFLSLGVLLSCLARRHATSASLAVAVWFVLVFFYDLGLLAVMVASDGGVPQETVRWLTALNPTGLYRMTLLVELTGAATLEDLGLAVELPGAVARGVTWAAWIALPLALGALTLHRRDGVTG